MKCKQESGAETTGSHRELWLRQETAPANKCENRSRLQCRRFLLFAFAALSRAARTHTQDRRSRAAPLYMSHDCSCLYQLPGRKLGLAASWPRRTRSAAAGAKVNHHQRPNEFREAANAIGLSRSSLVGHELGSNYRKQSG